MATYRPGRSKAPEWDLFEEVEDCHKVRCKQCEAEVSKKIERVRAHLEKCRRAKRQRDEDEDEEDVRTMPTKSPKLDRWVIRTTGEMKVELDKQYARGIYAGNIAFNAADNPHMRKFVEMTRGGTYEAPGRKHLAGHLLDTVSEDCEGKLHQHLAGKDVVLVQDGWSNVHNQPVIGSCLHTGDASFFVGAIDTGANKKTAQYIAQLADEEIKRCEKEYGCKVVGFVSDNEAKMVAMRRILEEHRPGFVTLGCAAHFINLALQEISPKPLIGQIVEVQKYFRNHHLPAAWLEEKPTSVKPQLPNDTRWLSHEECVKTYVRNYPHYVNIATEHEQDMDEKIKNIVDNSGVYKTATHLEKQLSAVSAALNRLQSDTCCAAEGVDVWMQLLDNSDLEPHRSAIQRRFQQWLKPVHLVAYKLHPEYRGDKLSADQDNQVHTWLEERNPAFVGPLLLFEAKDAKLPKALFSETSTSAVKPGSWWRILHNGVKKSDDADAVPEDFVKLVEHVQSVPCSSASIERCFSTLGNVHSKLRNRLAVTKAAKLAKCYSLLKCDEPWW